MVAASGSRAATIVSGGGPLAAGTNSLPPLLKPENQDMHAWPPLRRQPGDPRVVISLSTVPGGVEGLGPTLRSLRDQSFPADAIELNLPNASRRGLGAYPDLDLLTSSTYGVDVYHTEDWLALTNVVPTVQRARAANRTTLVVVVDDDKVYPPSLVEDHVRAHRERPGAASACRGFLMPPGGDLARVEFWPMWDELAHSVYGHKVAGPKRVAVVTGSDSWAAPADLLGPGIWKDLAVQGEELGGAGDAGRNASASARSAALLMNDVWISGQLSRRGVSKYVVPCRRECCDAPKGRDRSAQTLVHNMTQRRELNQEVMQLFLKDWAADEVMPMREVMQSIWEHQEKFVPQRPPRPPFLSWFAGRLASGFRALLGG